MSSHRVTKLSLLIVPIGTTIKSQLFNWGILMSNKYIEKMVMTEPTPEEVKELRKKASLTSEKCANFFNYKNGSTWRKKELPVTNKNKRNASVAEHEILLLISDSHPIYKLTEKKKVGEK